MTISITPKRILCSLLAVAVAAALPAALQALDPEYTAGFYCEDFSSTGSNPFLPLWPGLQLVLEGEEDGAVIRVVTRPRPR